MTDRVPAKPRTAWTVAHDHEQYGRFTDRKDAELEAARRRQLGEGTVTIFEVWISPHEQVVGIAECRRCGTRMPRFDGRVIFATSSIFCGPCSEKEFGHWDEEPTLVNGWPVKHGYVNEAGEYKEFDRVGAAATVAWAVGDFRTYETTFAAFGDGDVVEVQLISERGDHAHFAMDRQLAAVVAKELERQLTEASTDDRRRSGSSHHDRFLLSPPPRLVPFQDSETDVFWTFDEAPKVRVTQEEPSGDRIVLSIRSNEASLGITMQGGVANALRKFLARAGGR
jgi:hypothetical protein